MYRGTTPTLNMRFPEGTDFSDANVYVTLSDERMNVIMTTTDIEINDNVISLYLSQEQSLALPRIMLVQVNWTYADSKRACSNIVSIDTKRNLVNEVL